MTNIKNWKSYAFAALLVVSSLIIALQPTLTDASPGSGGHIGG